jgi:hypothetical protein
MKMHAVIALALISVLGTTTFAHSREWQQPPRAGNASPARPDDEPRPLMTNVRVEITVTDTMGAVPTKKSISMIIADGRMGRIRTAREQSPAVLNVDATPSILGDQIRLQLSLEYSPPLSAEASTRLSHVSEMVTLMVVPGKPILVSQAADPSADRKVTVEVTATILK